MYCSSCGVAVTQQLKYCNRCGARLINDKETGLVESAEKSLHDETVDLFWVTVMGLALIVGGIAVMKKALGLGEGLIIAYMILSSLAFAINFGLSLWQIRRLAEIAKETRRMAQPDFLQVAPSLPPQTHPVLEATPSVTEHTTRGLEPIARKPST